MTIGSALHMLLLAPRILTSADTAVRYKARVVSGVASVPESCNKHDCAAEPATPCRLQAVIEAPLREAGADGVDLLVFPEAYFSDAPQILACDPPSSERLLPEPSAEDLCPSDGEPGPWWRQVACWAKMYRMVVVVGTYEWGPCLPGLNPFTHRAFPCVGNLTIFNVAPAFGAEGQLLAVHRKHHLAHDLWPTQKISQRLHNGLLMNPSPFKLINIDASAAWPVNDAVTFTSHFGVTFGIVICHELPYAGPILSLKKAGVGDIIFPTWWGGWSGAFPGEQSGYAVAHGVNLIAANAASGGSGIWPADPLVRPVQYPIASATDSVPPQWFGTMELMSRTGPVAMPPVVPPPKPHRVISNVTHFVAASVSNGNGIRSRATVNGTICQFNLSVSNGSGAYLLGVSKGVNWAGLYETTCWMASCDLMHKRLSTNLAPNFLTAAHYPFSQEDLDFCAGQPGGSAIGLKDMQIQMTGAEANFIWPVGQCSDGLVPFPRPMVEPITGGSGGSMALSPLCALDFAALRGFAQSEFEESQCPDGFCPSPSQCSNATWDIVDGALCDFLPAPDHDEWLAAAWV